MSDLVGVCSQGPYTKHWLNLECYELSQLPWFFVGCGLWAVVYGIIVYRGVKYRWVEMPAMAAAANIAWEFDWAFVHSTNMGKLAVYTYMIWFFMDVAIFYLVWKYGAKQGFAPSIQRVFRPVFVGATVGWALLIASYRLPEYPDHYIGAVSAYAVNIVLSGTYLFQLSRVTDLRLLSTWVAWLKMVGTLLNTVFMFIVFPEDGFLQTMGVIVWVLDMLYIYCLRVRRLEERDSSPKQPVLQVA